MIRIIAAIFFVLPLVFNSEAMPDMRKVLDEAYKEDIKEEDIYCLDGIFYGGINSYESMIPLDRPRFVQKGRDGRDHLFVSLKGLEDPQDIMLVLRQWSKDRSDNPVSHFEIYNHLTEKEAEIYKTLPKDSWELSRDFFIECINLDNNPDGDTYLPLERKQRQKLNQCISEIIKNPTGNRLIRIILAKYKI